MKRKNLIYSCASLLLLVRADAGQTINPPRFVAGVHLQEQGKSSEAVQALTLFLHNNPCSSGKEEGVALNALGSAYQDLEHFEEARRSYDRALLILENQANAKREYALTLDNLGSLELAIGNIEESKRLRKRAHVLYGQLRSHSGLRRTSNNLAVIAFTAGKLREADAYVSEAIKETASASDVTPTILPRYITFEATWQKAAEILERPYRHKKRLCGYGYSRLPRLTTKLPLAIQLLRVRRQGPET